MTRHSCHQQPAATPESSATLLSTMEQELHEGYLEVEITGISLRRLATAYLALMRGAWLQTTESLRSPRRATPAH